MNGHRTRMDHETARARFSALIDGALGAAEAAQVDAHLEQCAECRAGLAQLRATVRLVREVEPVQVPEGFAAAVRGRVEQLANVAPRPGWTRLRALVPNLRWSWMTAAAA
ncbi:MAG: anti-sigma factor family protein, partial [Armatimonadota bacterium]